LLDTLEIGVSFLLAKSNMSKWIQNAIKHPGALRKALGAKKGKNIPAGKLAKAAKKRGKLGKRARLAINLKKLARRKKKLAFVQR